MYILVMCFSNLKCKKCLPDYMRACFETAYSVTILQMNVCIMKVKPGCII